jgi:uncharacterized membrane protein
MKRLAEFVAAVLGPALVAETGAWGTYAWTSVVLGAPGYRLGGGTDEILKNAIAQRVLGSHALREEQLWPKATPWLSAKTSTPCGIPCAAS